MTTEIQSPLRTPSGFNSLDVQLGWRGGWKGGGDLFDIRHRPGVQRRLIAEYEGDSGSAWVVVEDPVSYRVCDERELLPYWDQRSEEGVRISFAYEIARSAYLDEMANGLTALSGGVLRHFLLSGQNLCLEVIATDLPEILYERPDSLAGD